MAKPHERIDDGGRKVLAPDDRTRMCGTLRAGNGDQRVVIKALRCREEGAASEIGWQAMKKATAEGTLGCWESAAIASRLASSVEALKSGMKSSANCLRSVFDGWETFSKFVTVAISTTSFFLTALGLSSSRNRSVNALPNKRKHNIGSN